MKRILAIILILVMLVCAFAACEKKPEKPSGVTTAPGANGDVNSSGDSSLDEEVKDRLNGKTPKELYDATLAELASMDEYEIKHTDISTTVFAGESIVNESVKEYKLKGNNAFIKMPNGSGKITEISIVDGIYYINDGVSKQKLKLDFETFKKAYIFDMSTFIIPLGDEYFEDIKFELYTRGDSEDEGEKTDYLGDKKYYTLTIAVSEVDYEKHMAIDASGMAEYIMLFDANGAIVNTKLTADVKASQSVPIEFLHETDFSKAGKCEAITAPEDADEYRYAPSLDEIDMSKLDSLEGVEVSTEATDYVMLDIAGHGKIVIRLFPDVAPDTVANFKKLVEFNYYDGRLFHRVVKDFMIQGGMKGDGQADSNQTTIKGEFNSNGFINNLSHLRGVVSMARTLSSYDSASTQFFIMHADNNIDGDYASFGYVVYGMDTVDSIAAVSVSDEEHGNRPTTDVIITSARFVTVK